MRLSDPGCCSAAIRINRNRCQALPGGERRVEAIGGLKKLRHRDPRFLVSVQRLREILMIDVRVWRVGFNAALKEWNACV